MKSLLPLLTILAALPFAACTSSSYDTPTHPANLAAITGAGVKKSFSARPAIHYPATIALVHVQGSGSVESNRELESDPALGAVKKLPGLAGIAPLNHLLISQITSDEALRSAAARLHTDAIFVYTVETKTSTVDYVPLLMVATLGVAPTHSYRITSTASGILLDTRTGFVYGALEETAKHSGVTMPSVTGGMETSATTTAEREAFRKLIGSFSGLWQRTCQHYGGH